MKTKSKICSWIITFFTLFNAIINPIFYMGSINSYAETSEEAQDGTQNTEVIDLNQFDTEVDILNDSDVIFFESKSQTVSEDDGEINIVIKRLKVGEEKNLELTFNGTCTEGEDYSLDSKSITFDGGEMSKEISLRIIDDDEVEATEEINILLESNGGFKSDCRIEIRDNDKLENNDLKDNDLEDNSSEDENLENDTEEMSLGEELTTVEKASPISLSFSAGDYSVQEDAGEIEFTVHRSGVGDGEVTVDFETGSPQASPNIDFEYSRGTITFKAGETEKKIKIKIIDDSRHEKKELMTIELKEPTGGAILGENPIKNIYIEDNDEKRTFFSFEKTEYKFYEGGYKKPAKFKILRTGNLDDHFNLDIVIEPTAGSDFVNYGDYNFYDSSVFFHEGEKEVTISMEIMEDDLDEAMESFTLKIKNRDEGKFEASTAYVEVYDKDNTVEFDGNSWGCYEGSKDVEVVVNRSGAVDQEVWINYETQDISAEKGKDYESVKGTLIFSKGETRKSIKLNILDDNSFEDKESFKLKITDAKENVKIKGIGEMTVNITDDDSLAGDEVVRIELKGVTYNPNIKRLKVLIKSKNYFEESIPVIIECEEVDEKGNPLVGDHYKEKKDIKLNYSNEIVDIDMDIGKVSSKAVAIRLKAPSPNIIIEGKDKVCVDIASKIEFDGRYNNTVYEEDEKEIQLVLRRTGYLNCGADVDLEFDADYRYNPCDFYIDDENKSNSRISFSTGESEKVIRIKSKDDASFEGTETINLIIKSVCNSSVNTYIGDNNKAAFTINERDGEISSIKSFYNAVESEDGTLDITFLREGYVECRNEMFLTWDTDYITIDTNKIVFEPDETEKTVTLKAKKIDGYDDILIGMIHYYSNDKNMSFNKDIRIRLQEEPLGKLEFYDDWDVHENYGYPIYVDIGGSKELLDSNKTIKVKYKIIDGTAKEGEDFTVKSKEGIIDVKPYKNYYEKESNYYKDCWPIINIVDDRLPEDDEYFEIHYEVDPDDRIRTEKTVARYTIKNSNIPTMSIDKPSLVKLLPSEESIWNIKVADINKDYPYANIPIVVTEKKPNNDVIKTIVKTDEKGEAQYKVQVPEKGFINGTYNLDYKMDTEFEPDLSNIPTYNRYRYIENINTNYYVFQGYTNLSGTVYHAESKKTLNGVEVSVYKYDKLVKTTRTNEEGQYRIEGLEQGDEYTIEVEHPVMSLSRTLINTELDTETVYDVFLAYDTGVKDPMLYEFNMEIESDKLKYRRYLDVIDTYDREYVLSKGKDINTRLHMNWNGHRPKKVQYIFKNGNGDTTNVIDHPVGAYNNAIINQRIEKGKDWKIGDRLFIQGVTEVGTTTKPVEVKIVLIERSGIANAEGLVAEEQLPSVESPSTPDDFEFLNNLSIALKFSSVNIEVKKESNGTMKMEIGKGIKDKQFGSNSGKERLESLRSELKKIKDQVKKTVNSKSKFSIGKSNSDKGAELLVSGSLTLKWDDKNAEWKFHEGSMALVGEASFKKGKQFVIVCVPVYVEGEIIGKLEAALDFDYSEKKLKLIGRITPTLTGNIYAGLGSEYVGVGIYGKIEPSVDFKFQKDGTDIFFKMIMELGGEVRFLFFKAREKVFEHTWEDTIKKGTSDKNESSPAMARSMESDYFASAFEEIDRVRNTNFALDFNEMNEVKLWDLKPMERTGSNNSMMFRALRTDEDGDIISKDVFGDAKPKVVELEDGYLGVWIDDIKERSDMNRTAVVYSIFDEENWSEPIQINNDNTADFNADLAMTSRGGAAVWQNTSKELDDTATIKDFMANTEIKASTFEVPSKSEANQWNNTIALTDDLYYDGVPSISFDGSRGMVVWSKYKKDDLSSLNTIADILNADPKYIDIMFSKWDGNQWSEPQTVISNEGSLSKGSLAYDGYRAIYAYEADKDLDFITSIDKEINIITYDDTGEEAKGQWSEPISITSNGVSDTNPRVIYYENKPVLFWNQDGKIVYVRDFETKDIEVAVENVSKGIGFEISQNNKGIMTLAWTEGSGKIFTSVFDPESNIWSQKLEITDTNSEKLEGDAGSKISRYFDASLNDKGDIMALYDCVELVEKAGGIEAGRTDLKYASYEIGNDLAINGASISFSNDNPMPGNNITISALLQNLGEFVQKNIEVSFYDGDPEDGGILIDTVEITDILGGKEDKIVSTDWNIPIEQKNHNIYIIVDPKNRKMDRDRSNNIAASNIVKPDLEISDIKTRTLQDKRKLYVKINNNGSVIAENSLLELYVEGKEERRLIDTVHLGDITPMAQIEKSIEWTPKDSDFNEGFAKLDFIVDSDTDDYDYSNNIYGYNEKPIEKKEALVPKSLKLNKSNLKLGVNTTETLIEVFSPMDSEYKKVIWSIDNPSIAHVDQNGRVKGINKGTGVITAKTEDGILQAQCTVEVTDPPFVVLSGDTEMRITRGDTFTDPGAKAYDGETDISKRIEVTGDEIDTSIVGSNEIYYYCTSEEGVASQVKVRKVIVAPEKVKLSNRDNGIKVMGVEGLAGLKLYDINENLIKAVNVMDASNDYIFKNIDGDRGYYVSQTVRGIESELSYIKVDKDSNAPVDKENNYVQKKKHKPKSKKYYDKKVIKLDKGRQRITYTVNKDVIDLLKNSTKQDIDMVYEAKDSDVSNIRIPNNLLSHFDDRNISININKVKLKLSKELIKKYNDNGKDINLEISLGDIEGIKKIQRDVKIIGSPIEIKADINMNTDVYVPLDGELLLERGMELRKYLDKLRVLVVHSDGDIEYKKGNISYDQRGNPIGIKVTVDRFSTFAIVKEQNPIMKNISFKDIEGMWAKEYIEQLVLKGAVSGYPDGYFRPDKNITRGEFVSIISKAFDLKDKKGIVYSDTKNHWAREYIDMAAAGGIVKGYNENSFGPNDFITREQMAVIISRIIENQNQSNKQDFKDWNEIADWAKASVEKTYNNNIINGYPDKTFKPKKYVTRGEAATVIIKALNQN
ncbi:MAG: S-layer homology domain-containing protein [Maledivibacter sp.]|jgi:hypothetical protein|nr:S-layer homology domain-containing protein [Maledivibacter sp.]